jgi:Cu(I)/Ag(I) efflux system membrane protein CusA/SilA
MINSENAMLRGTVLFNVRGRDMGSVVSDAKRKLMPISKTSQRLFHQLEWTV